MLITKGQITLFIISSFITEFRSRRKSETGQLAQDKRELAMKFEIASILNRCTTELSSNKDINLAINNILQIVNEYFYERTFYAMNRKLLFSTLTVHSLRIIRIYS